MRLLVSTAACFVIVNLMVAQVIVRVFYPDAGTRLGPAGIGALAVLGLVCTLYAVRGWREYLRRPRP